MPKHLISRQVNLLKVKKKVKLKKKRTFKKPFKRRLGVSRGEAGFINIRRRITTTPLFHRNVIGKSGSILI